MGTGIYLVRVLKRPAVDAVVRRVETALGEPDDVARLEVPGADSLERTIPVEGLLRNLGRSARKHGAMAGELRYPVELACST